MRYLILAVLAAAVLTPIRIPAQATVQVSEKEFVSKFDAFVRRVMQRFPEVTSFSIVVVRDDKPLFLRAYGFANKEAGIKANENTLYYNGSHTKSFMGMAAALIDKEGKLRLDDPIAKHTTGVTFKAQIPEKVTVRNLLTHTSGLRNPFLVNRMAFSGQIDQKEIDHVFSEGTTYDEQRYGKYAYDNLGYNIYGILARRTLNKRWQDILHDRIFKPIGMRRSTAVISKARAAKWPIAEAYILNGDTGEVIRSPLQKQDNNMQSAGGTFTSAVDVARWMRLNINGGKLDGKQVVPADVMSAVHTGYAKVERTEGAFTGAGEYGLGWQIGRYRDEKVIYHHGGYVGWSMHFSFMPERKIGVSVMTNEGMVGSRLNDVLATYAYDTLTGRPDIETAYAKLLDDLYQQHQRSKQNALNSFRSRAGRTSQLSRPLTEYAGTYTNHLLGTIDIIPESTTLRVKMGNINLLSSPFTQKDTIRVEMTPSQGDVISFVVSEAGKVEALTWAGQRFTRVQR
jgi:CubicO group peptidase (beta-lactamase class C family)